MQGSFAVARLAFAEKLADAAENVQALGLVNGRRRGDRRDVTSAECGFGNGLLVLGLRGGRGPRGL